ncbi:MAG: cupin-like domain-containing protein [Gammaproteobacteria bacterium]|nr:cupin-like domain-containing protein [Gammaproteobacteria bacterium]
MAVPHETSLDTATFPERYRKPRKPVFLDGVMQGWSAVGKITPEYLRRTYPDKIVHAGNPGKDYRMADMMDLIEASTPQRPSPYPCAMQLVAEIPELIPDLPRRFEQSLPHRQDNPLLLSRLFNPITNRPTLFFSGDGCDYPILHYDIKDMHTWVCQLYGKKEYVLYPPGQDENMYVKPDRPAESEVVNAYDPDLDRYPLLGKAKSIRVTLEAGDVMFMPCHWWHVTRTHGGSISFNFDQLAADNWADFTRYILHEKRLSGCRGGKYTIWQTYFALLGPWMRLTELLGGNRRRQWPGAR